MPMHASSASTAVSYTLLHAPTTGRGLLLTLPLLQRNGWAVIATDSDYKDFDFTAPHRVSIEIQASVVSLTVIL